MIRLDTFISNAASYSRSEIKNLVKKGKVTVNGVVIFDHSVKISEIDSVSVDGSKLNNEKFVYILLNKPSGYVSSTEGKKSVLSLVPADLYRKNLFPVGRLDKDTEGLLLLTNDGEFAHNLMSPKKNIIKTYRAYLERSVTSEDIERFGQGIKLRSGISFKPAKLLSAGDKIALVEISEGKYHQVKLMFSATENKVLHLERVAIGGLTIPIGLERGECIRLSGDKILQSVYRVSEYDDLVLNK